MKWDMVPGYLNFVGGDFFVPGWEKRVDIYVPVVKLHGRRSRAFVRLQALHFWSPSERERASSAAWRITRTACRTSIEEASEAAARQAVVSESGNWAPLFGVCESEGMADGRPGKLKKLMYDGFGI